MSSEDKKDRGNSVRINATNWPPQEKDRTSLTLLSVDSGSKAKEGSVNSSLPREKGQRNTNSVHLIQSNTGNMFIQKIAQEKTAKGLGSFASSSSQEQQHQRNSNSVQDMIRTFERPVPKRKQNEGRKQQATLSKSKAKVMKGRQKSNFSAKNRYTDALPQQVLSSEEKKKIKARIKQRRSNKRILSPPRRKRVSNKRNILNPVVEREREPEVRERFQEASPENEGNEEIKEKEKEEEGVEETKEKEEEVLAFEKEIIKSEEKKYNGALDNNFRNFIAKLKPTGGHLKRPSMKRGIVEDVIGVQGDLEEDENAQEEIQQFAKPKPVKSPKIEKVNKNPRALKNQSKEPEVRNYFGRENAQNLNTKPVSIKPREEKNKDEVKSSAFAEIVVEEVKPEEAKEEQIIKSPKEEKKERDLGTKRNFPLFGTGRRGKKDMTLPRAPKEEDTVEVKEEAAKREDDDLSMTFQSPAKQATLASTQYPPFLKRGREESNFSSLSAFLNAKSPSTHHDLPELKMTFDDTSTTNRLSAQPFVEKPPSIRGVHIPANHKLRPRRKSAQSKARTVTSVVTSRTAQSLTSVLDPLSYVYSARYRENMEDIQDSFLDLFACFRSVNSPHRIIGDKVKAIKNEAQFVRAFEVAPKEAIEDVERYSPLLLYTEDASHPRNYNSFVMLLSAKQLGEEIRFSNVWLEIKKILEVRLKTQVLNINSDQQTPLVKLNSLQAAIVCMEDLHKIDAQIKGRFFRPCRQFVMNFLNSAAQEQVFSDSTERTTFLIVKKLHKRLRRVIKRENRLRRQEVALILIEGNQWQCDLCHQRKGPFSKFQKRLPNCEHIYHKECIENWLLEHYVCPVCNEAADKAAPKDLTPVSRFLCEFVYYVLIFFPLVGTLVGSIVGGLGIFIAENIESESKVDVENHGFLKVVVVSYALGFFAFGAVAQGISFFRFFGTAEYDSDVWLLVPCLLGLVWSPFFAFLLSDQFQDPNDFEASQTLRQTWKGFSGMMVVYVALVLFTHLYTRKLAPYFAWCLVNLRESMAESTLFEKFYAVYWWTCCSPIYFCLFGEEQSEAGDSEFDQLFGDDDDFLKAIKSPDLESMDREMEEKKPVKESEPFFDSDSEDEKVEDVRDLQNIFGDVAKKSRSSTFADTMREMDAETNLSYQRTKQRASQFSDDIAENGESSML